ncbi:hypothetical protein FE257_010837 [Aspergillus nanangensis]|uniref:Uncharacterized protein n=1 Tax=Aspergillus nanangensis TaxID=2582783 RepID=A0AAD4CVL2_ASPNN|nr:hypothetical protein FE257_010837 [Aspergillus nanangensis]
MKVRTDGTWFTTWREDASSGMDYAFIFADTSTSAGYITVTGPAKDKIPCDFNAWTGDKVPIFTYNVSDSGFTLPVSLNGNQTLIIVFVSPQPHSPEAAFSRPPLWRLAQMVLTSSSHLSSMQFECRSMDGDSHRWITPMLERISAGI